MPRLRLPAAPRAAKSSEEHAHAPHRFCRHAGIAAPALDALAASGTAWSGC